MIEKVVEWILGIVSVALFGLVGVVYRNLDEKIKTKASNEVFREVCNDMRSDLSEIKGVIDKTQESVVEIGKSLAFLKGRMDEDNHRPRTRR